MTREGVLAFFVMCGMFGIGALVGWVKGIQKGSQIAATISVVTFMVTAEVTYGIEWFWDFLEELHLVSDIESERIEMLSRKLNEARKNNESRENLLHLIMGGGEGDE